MAHGREEWYAAVTPLLAPRLFTLGFVVPRYACPFCSALTEVPDDWPHPGFTCVVCHRPVTFAPGTQPSAQAAQGSAHSGEPDFIPIVPPPRWGWTPWLVVLLGAAIIGSVVAYLVTEDDIWFMALGIPAIVLMGILAVVWIVLSGKTEPPEDAETPPG